MMPTDPEAQQLAGEILVLHQKGAARTPREEARYAGLLTRFGDHQESALSIVRAIGKTQR